MCITLEENPSNILEAIRSRCRKKTSSKGQHASVAAAACQDFVNAALDVNLHKLVFECVLEKSPTDDSNLFSLCGDILVDLFRRHEVNAVYSQAASPSSAPKLALGLLKENKSELREFIDTIVQFLQSQLRKLKQIDASKRFIACTLVYVFKRGTVFLHDSCWS